jgi:arylsulfatase/uncharacterized sulfatase
MPVQAPQEFIDRYMGVYDSGWETLRQQRLARAVELGIVPRDTALVTMATTDEWDVLSEEHRAYQAKSMAVYAGMVEAMDFHIGRLVDYLQRTGQYDNTLFIFTSDNGAEASGLANPTVWWNRLFAAQNGYRVDYETLGLKGSFNAISPSFASAAASPLAFYKFYVGEGGMRVPLIIAGETLPRKGQLSPAFTWVTDLAATILDLADVAAPQDRYAGRPVEPITGRSLSPLLTGNAGRIHTEEEAIGYELSGHSVLFQGGYKLARNRAPVGDNQWHLYDIGADPGESRDLREAMPERFEQMLARYEAFAEANGVLPVPDGYNYLVQTTLNGLHDRFGPQLLVLLFTLLVLLPFYLFHRLKKNGAIHG